MHIRVCILERLLLCALSLYVVLHERLGASGCRWPRGLLTLAGRVTGWVWFDSNACIAEGVSRAAHQPMNWMTGCGVSSTMNKQLASGPAGWLKWNAFLEDIVLK